MAKRRNFNHALKFIVLITILSIPLSIIFDTGTLFLKGIPWIIGIFVMILIVIFGAFFDMIGVAAAAADESPFLSMASRRISGAKAAVFIIRHAERVASICSDVIGDIAGVLSGAIALAVGAQISEDLQLQGWKGESISIALTVVATALTIGCKALGKTIAVYFPKPIILYSARTIEPILKLFSKKWRRK